VRAARCTGKLASFSYFAWLEDRRSLQTTLVRPLHLASSQTQRKGGEMDMKTIVKMLALVFLVGSLGSGCATVNRLNVEYEEETTRIAKLTPQEKAEWEKSQRDEAKFELRSIYDDSESE
jgi:hypothetical protein